MFFDFTCALQNKFKTGRENKMFNKIMFFYSAAGTMLHFFMTLAFVYLTRVSEIDLAHGIILIALTVTGFFCGVISTLHYEDQMKK